MHPSEVRQNALSLIAAGVNDCEIARRLGVARSTVRDWRRPRYVPKTQRDEICPRCWRTTRPVVFAPSDYCELLGLYLGDGHITALPRTERLRIFLDGRYVAIVRDTESLLRRCFPSHRVGRLDRYRGTMAVLSVYYGHLSCLLPQHGPGKKHAREIALESWQHDLFQQAPWSFIKGCIRSDGCVFVNRTGRYEYLSYDFANVSQDILDLFAETCLSLDLNPRRYARHIRLYRRADVALVREHVGLKS